MTPARDSKQSLGISVCTRKEEPEEKEEKEEEEEEEEAEGI